MDVSTKLMHTLGIVNKEEVNSNIDLDTGEMVVREPAKFEIVQQKSALEEMDIESDMVDDYIHSRNILYTLMTITGDALAGAKRMADDTEHPRSYEVLNGLANTTRELVKDLLVLQKSLKDLTKDRKEFEPPPPPATSTNINMFVGETTSDVIARFKAQADAEKDSARTVDG